VLSVKISLWPKEFKISAKGDKREMAAGPDRFVRTRRHLRAFMLLLTSGQTCPLGDQVCAGGYAFSTRETGSTLTRHQVDRRVLATSINFDVEFQTVALGQLTQARTFHCADMHEGIRLAIITGDEAKALQSVEELHRAGRLVAGQLTLRRRGSLGNGDHFADHDQIAGRHLAAAIHQGEFQILTFGQTFKTGALNCADVHEHIFAAVFTLDKAEALLAIEELDDALALANDLSRETTASAATVTTAEAAATGRTATEAAATGRTAAEAAAITTAEATTAAATKAITATAKAIAATTKTVTAACERIEAVFAKTVALVSAPAATPSIKTHKPERTFASP